MPQMFPMNWIFMPLLFLISFFLLIFFSYSLTMNNSFNLTKVSFKTQYYWLW